MPCKEKLDGTTATKITHRHRWTRTTWTQLCALIDEYKPDIVMNIALPYQDLTIMDACLECGVNYMDTANYEPEDTDDPEWRAIYEKRCKDEGFTAYFDYSWQWAYKKKFEEAGLTALLGCGFDPGVTQAYSALTHRSIVFDEIDYHRHPGLQRRRPRLSVRDQLQPGDQSCARSPRQRLATGKTVTGLRSRPMEHQARVRLRSGRPKGHVPAAPRGDRVPGAEHSGRPAHPLLHDLRPELPDPS